MMTGLSPRHALAPWLLVAITASALEIHVAPEGKDTHAGTREQPLSTLEVARDAAREVARAAAHPSRIEICLHPGTYRRTQTLELDARDSDTTYRAEGSGSVRLSGGKAVPPLKCQILGKAGPEAMARFPEALHDRILWIDLEDEGIDSLGPIGARGFLRSTDPAPVELVIDDRIMQCARWPNQGSKPFTAIVDQGSLPRDGDFSNRGGTFRFENDRLDRWSQALARGADMYVAGFFKFGWAYDQIGVASVDPDKHTVTLSEAHMYGLSVGKKKHGRFWVLNLPEDIDMPGEYAIDRNEARLYFLPPASFDPARSRIELTSLSDPMVAIENARNIRWKGVTFESARGMAVYIESGANHRVERCSFRNLGTVAVMTGQGAEQPRRLSHDDTLEPVSRQIGNLEGQLYNASATDRNAGTGHVVADCQIHDTGAGGIILGGGRRADLTPGNSRVENCDIHHVNRWYLSYRPAVYLTGVGNVVRNCHIHDCAGAAIRLWGNDHLIEYNDIHHAMTVGGHNGAIYMGRNPSEWGNTIRYNYIHDIRPNELSINKNGPFGIHLDDYACGVTIQGNAFHNCELEIRVNGGKEHRVVNNLFVDNGLSDGRPSEISGGKAPKAIYDWMHQNAIAKARLAREIDITEPPYSTRYPELLKLYTAPPKQPRINYIERNLIVRACEIKRPWNQLKDNYRTNKNPGFENWKKGDFRLRKNSVVWKKIPGFKPIPFEQIGLTGATGVPTHQE